MTGYFDRLANIKGKVAVLVGGGDGVGRGVSLALAEAGCDLAICDWEEAGTAETVAAAKAHGVKVVSRIIDATVTEQLSAFFDQVAQEFPGGIDILVNLVGGVKRMQFADSTPADWQRDIHRNFGYALESTHRAIHMMRKKGNGGSIINFTTIEAHRGAASFSVYAGAKAATTNFSRSMAVELGKDRIRVNCIAPDTTPTRGNMAAMPPSFLEGFARLPAAAQGKGMEMYIPAGEQPPVEAMGDAVLFLASDLSRFVSGMTLHVDGGTMAAAGFLDWPFGDGFVPVPMGGTLGRIYREGDEI